MVPRRCPFRTHIWNLYELYVQKSMMMAMMAHSGAIGTMINATVI